MSVQKRSRLIFFSSSFLSFWGCSSSPLLLLPLFACPLPFLAPPHLPYIPTIFSFRPPRLIFRHLFAIPVAHHRYYRKVGKIEEISTRKTSIWHPPFRNHPKGLALLICYPIPSRTAGPTGEWGCCMIHFLFPTGRHRLHAPPGHPSLPDSFLTLILDPYFALKKRKKKKREERKWARACAEWPHSTPDSSFLHTPRRNIPITPARVSSLTILSLVQRFKRSKSSVSSGWPGKKIYKKSIMAHKELTIEKNNALSPFPYHTKKNWGKSFFGKVSNH